MSMFKLLRLLPALLIAFPARSQTGPAAANLSVITDEDTMVAGVLAATDSDGDALTYRVVTQPAHGALVAILVRGSFIYEPVWNYNGEDSFTFVANDGTTDSAPATVSLTIKPVNDKPVAKGAVVSTDEDVPLNGVLSATDEDEDDLVFRLVTPPRYGSVSIQPGGQFIYTPNENFCGFDKFGYVAKDAIVDSAEAIVSLIVKPVNDAPVANPVSLAVPPNRVFIGQLQGFDADGDSLRYTKTSDPSYGSVTLEANGRFTYRSPDGKGRDSFTYQVGDGTETSQSASVSIFIGLDSTGFVADTLRPQLLGISFPGGSSADPEVSPPVPALAAARDIAVDRANSRLYALTADALNIYDIDLSASPMALAYRQSVEVSGHVLALAPDGRTAYIGGTGSVIAINLYTEATFDGGQSVDRPAYANIRTFPFSPNRAVASMAVHPAGDRLMVVIDALVKKININNDLLRSDVGNGVRTENLSASDLPEDFGYITQLPIATGTQTGGAGHATSKFSAPIGLKELIYSIEKQVAIGVKGMAFSPDGNCLFLTAVGAQTARATAFGIFPTSDEGTGGIVVLDVRPSGETAAPWVQYLGFIPTTERGEKTADLRMSIRKQGWTIVHPQVQWARNLYSITEGALGLTSMTPFTALPGLYGYTVASKVLAEMEDSFKDYGYMQAYSRLYPRDMVGASSIAVNHVGDFGVVTMQDTNNLGLLDLRPSDRLLGYTFDDRPDFSIKMGTGSAINGYNAGYYDSSGGSAYSWAYPQKAAFTSDDTRLYIGMAGGTPKADLSNKFGFADALVLKTERDRPDSVFKGENPPPGYALVRDMNMQSPRKVATLQSFDSDRDTLSDQLEAYNRWNIFRNENFGEKYTLISTNEHRVSDPGKPLGGLPGVPDYLDYGYLLPPSGIGYRMNTFGMPEGATNFVNRGAASTLEKVGLEWNKRYESHLRSATAYAHPVTRPYFIVGLLGQPGGGIMKNVQGEALKYTPGNGSEASFPYFSQGSDNAHDFVLSNDAAEPRNNTIETIEGFDLENTEALIRLLLEQEQVRKIELDPYVLELIPGIGNDARVVAHGQRDVKDSRRDLDNHMYVTFAGLSVDLDIDSDNDGVLDQNSNEDILERTEGAGGKILWANTRDRDADQIPDYADGYDRFADQSTDGASAEFTPMIIRLPDELDLGKLRFRLIYSESPPSAVTLSANPPFQYILPKKGAYRVWTKDGNRARKQSEIDAGGDFIASERFYPVPILDIDAGRSVTLYIESVGAPDSIGEKEIKVEIMSDGAGPISQMRWSDSVRVSSGISLVADTKVLLVNEGDADRDMIPDMADALDLYRSDGYHPPVGEVESAPLVPVTLHLTTTKLDGANVRIRFHYDGSDPARIFRLEGLEGNTYTPPSGSIRLWRRNTDGRQFPGDAARQPGRRVGSVKNGGDYIAPDQDFDPSELGFTDGVTSVPLYVETLRKSDATGDRAITVEMRRAIQASDFPSAAAVIEFTSLSVQLASVDKSNDTESVFAPELSFSAPEISLIKMKAQHIHPSSDGARLVGDVILQGSLLSAACDQSSDGIINEVSVFINDNEEAFAKIPTVVNKSADSGSFMRPFPFSATFESVLSDVGFRSGVNVVRVEARNPGGGQIGYQEFIVEVDARSPNIHGDDFAQLSLGLSGGIKPNEPDKLIVSFKLNGILETNVELTESGINSLVFLAPDGHMSLSLVSAAGGFDPAQIDELLAVLSHSEIDRGPLVFKKLAETSEDSLLFEQLIVVRGDGTRSSLSVKFGTKLTPGVVDGMTASLMVDGQEVSDVSLLETAADSKAFHSTDGAFTITVLSDTDALAPEDMDSLAVVVSHAAMAPEPVFFSRMEETLSDNQFFHQAMVSEVDDEDAPVSDPTGEPSPGEYLGHRVSNGPAAIVDEGAAGSVNPHMVRLDGPADFIESIESVDIGEGPRKVKKSPLDGNFYIQVMETTNPQLYKFVSAWRAAWNNDSLTDEKKVLLILEAIASTLEDEVQFRIGFAHGFVMGGWSLVVDAKDLVFFVGKAYVKWSPTAIQIRTILGDDFKVEREFFVSATESAGELWRFYWMLRQDEFALYEAIWSGDTATQSELTRKYGDALRCGAAVIYELEKIVRNLTPRERGYYQGRIAFEVVGLFISWEGKAASLVTRIVGKGAKLTNVNFIKVLAGTKFFSTSEKAQAAMHELAKAGGVLFEMATTKMCFVAGTKVHTRDGLMPIESIRPGIDVLARDVVSGVQIFKPVKETFITNPSQLYHILIRTDDPDNGEGPGTHMEQLACTGEHPFWVVEAGAFLPACELKAGDRLYQADGRLAEVVSAVLEIAEDGGCFTTYNFEVSDFNTYFVGEAGFLVHNRGSFCERLKELFEIFLKKANGDVWEAQKLVNRKFDSLARMDPRLSETGVARLQMFTEARRRHFSDLPSANPPWRQGGQRLTLTRPPAETEEMAAELRHNMKLLYNCSPEGYDLAAHHIVAPGRKGPNWDRARKVLADLDIHLNEAANGIYVPHKHDAVVAYPSLGKIHGKFHSDALAAKIADRLEQAAPQGKVAVQDELQRIANDIANGVLP